DGIMAAAPVRVVTDYAVRSLWFLPTSFRRQRRPAGAVLQDLARDHDLLHLGRTLVDAQRANLAVELLDLDALGDAGTAVQLHGAIDHPLRRLGRVHLRHRRFAGDACRALVLAPGGTIDEKGRGVDLAGAVGDRRLRQLQLGKWRAEEIAARRPRDGFLQGPTREAERGGADRRAEHVERRHRHLEAVAGLA